MFPIWLNRAFFYTIAWCLYSVQGVILPKGSLISQALIFVLFIVSLYYVFVVNTRYKLPCYFKGLNILLLLFSVYGIALVLGGYDADEYKNLPSSIYLKNIYISLLPTYAFFAFSKEKLISKKMLVSIIIILFFFVSVQFFQKQREMLAYAIVMHLSKEEFTNNFGYSFLALMPACAWLYKRPVIQYIALSYCMIFLLFGMKRGAILIGFFCIGWFLWCNLKNASIKKKILFLFLSMAICYVGYAFVQKQIEDSLYFQKRVEDTLNGDSSNRDKIYMRFAYYFWNETSPMQFVLGTGANATLKTLRVYAHNDWLEIAVNQGLLGVFIYAFYWFAFAKQVAETKSMHSKLALQMLFLIYFMKSFFSMSYGDMAIPATFILGYSLAQEEKQ